MSTEREKIEKQLQIILKAFAIETKGSEEIEEIVTIYIEMDYFTSKILARANDSWKSVEDCDALYIDLFIKLTKNLTGPTVAVREMAGVFRVHTGPNAKTPQFFGTSAGVSASLTHAEVYARVTFAGGDVSVFNFHLGAGVSTGGGIKDDSITVKVGGCGVQVGRKVGISVFDNELAIDFGKLVTSIW